MKGAEMTTYAVGYDAAKNLYYVQPFRRITTIDYGFYLREHREYFSDAREAYDYAEQKTREEFIPITERNLQND